MDKKLNEIVKEICDIRNYMPKKLLERLKNDDFDLDDLSDEEFLEIRKSAAPLFKQLKKAIKPNIIKQIEDSDCNPGILLIGGDGYLQLGIALYVHYIRKIKYFEPIPCNGLNEDEIKKELYPTGFQEKLEIKLFTTTLFIRDLNNRNILENIMKSVEAWKIHDSKYEGKCGAIVISTDDLDSLPEDFEKYFAVIYLKTKISFDDNTLTVSINGKEYTDLQDAEYKLFKLLYNKIGEIVTYKNMQTKEVLGSSASMQRIQNIKCSIENKFKGYVNIQPKRGVGYKMTV